MAKLTKKELSEHFDDRYTLVAFSNGRRYGFWDNKNILEAIQIQLKCSKMGESCYLFQQDKSAKVWSCIDDYERCGAPLPETNFRQFVRKMK